MMEKCFDEGTLQAFLDNELTPELSQRVARHLVDCDPCAVLLAKVEEETAFTFNALEQEFDTLVPTRRLWTKINHSIETQSRRRSVWQRLLTAVSGLNLLNPQIIAFGSLLLIVGIVSALIIVKKDNASGEIANRQSTIQTVETSKAPIADPAVPFPANETKSKLAVSSPYRPEKTDFVENDRRRKDLIRAPKDDVRPQPVVSQYLDGEESYVTTIARLEKTVDGSKDEVLKSSARFSYEKDLAIVNDSIKKMKAEVRKDPKNEDAKQVLFSTYQNKIELLNSVTQRGELMASLR